MIKRMPVADLRENPNNPRTIKDDKFRKLVQSVRDFPEMLEARPIVCTSDGVVLGGNMRLKALREAGIKDVPVYVVKWTENKQSEFLIKDNVGFGEWDWDILANEWDAAELEEWGLDVWQMPQEEPETFTDPDDVPELPIEATTQPGDIYVLGKHRVMCGDSTNPEHVARLMDGQKADLCFTSPPYLQQRDYTKEGKEKVQDWDALMCGVFANLQMKPKGQVLVNLGLVHQKNEWVPYWQTWIEWMRSEGWNRFGWYVWDSGFGLPGDWNGRFAPSHEFVFHFNKEAEKPKKIVISKLGGQKTKKTSSLRKKSGEISGFSQAAADGSYTRPDTKIPDSVIRVNRSYGKIRSEHPATFSVEFAEVFVQSWPGLVYEPFLGSGTTLIAAEQNAQPCFGMEISPNYCDVIVKRWEDFTKQKAQLIRNETDKNNK
jgi:DNA modification methylase